MAGNIVYTVGTFRHTRSSALCLESNTLLKDGGIFFFIAVTNVWQSLFLLSSVPRLLRRIVSITLSSIHVNRFLACRVPLI